ncbi:plasmid mobilization protein [Acidovorax sp. NCPPB 3576]|uniref:plasmid mobilization protein n=1 Tax=Acidovorax sp. NCPPB 3576 TaxID=2940488 RepID=UPI00234A2022|nr:hypothetical protein [Acidovorax sp. NCPPB 3576]WCM90659.1 hypothetical protein M5C98_11855 [Acidovorax sp. NCPPB 3576]
MQEKKKESDLRRSQILNLRLSKEEIERIDDLRQSTNRSRYIRSKALDIEIKDKSYIALISQFKRFNANFNQVAQALNIIKSSADKSFYNFSLIEKRLEECAQEVKHLSEEVDK